MRSFISYGKSVLLSIVFLFFLFPVTDVFATDITSAFTDLNFKSYVLSGFDANGDSVILDTEVKSVEGLYLDSLNISDLAGIEHFESLKLLNVNNNKLTSLVLTNNPNLKCLYVSGNKSLNILNVSKNINLEELLADDTSLTALDLTNNSYLRWLNVAKTLLIELDASNKKLVILDVSDNPKLKKLNVQGNQLSGHFYLSGTPLLEHLNLSGNKLYSVDVSKAWNEPKGPLTLLDVSNNLLDWVDASNNKLTSLDVRDNTALTWLRVVENELTSLDVTKNTSLINLYADGNELPLLDVTKNTALTELYVGNNKLDSLEVTKNTVLTVLNAGINKLKKLDVTKNTALTELRVGENELETLDVTKNTSLKTLSVNKNNLTSLDVTYTALSFTPPIITLNVSENFMPNDSAVKGWQGRGLVKGTSFVFDPQKANPYIAGIIPTVKAFPAANAGYSIAGMAQVFTIQNVASGTITGLTSSLGTANFEIRVSLSSTTLAPLGGTATISVSPKPGLLANAVPYTDTLTITGNNGIKIDVPLSFQVNPAGPGPGAVLYGDLNGSGSVDNSDLILMRRYMSGRIGIIISQANADVAYPYNGTPDLADMLLFMRYFVRPGIKLGP